MDFSFGILQMKYNLPHSHTRCCQIKIINDDTFKSHSSDFSLLWNYQLDNREEQVQMQCLISD